MNSVVLVILAAYMLVSVQAFAPKRVLSRVNSVSSFTALEEKRMRGDAKPVIDPNETQEQLENRMRKKARKMMYNENGVAYAPWVSGQIDEDAIVKDLIRKEKDAANPRQQTSILDRGEIVGSDGMKWRMSNSQVQLAWSTGGEADNQGYIVEKRPSYGGDFQEIASFREVTALQSQGGGGGKYSYTDPSSAAGSWIYRVQDCDNAGKTNTLCQCFVEVQTEAEQSQQTGVLVGLVAILAVAAAAGSLLDPAMQ